MTPSECKQCLSRLHCVVIIPTYNNGGTITDVVSDVLRYCEDVIVIDDGSTDETSCLLRNYKNIVIIRHKKNLGKGAAILSGFEAASKYRFRTKHLGYNAHYAITIDADGQHDAADIISFAEEIQKHPNCLLIGIRSPERTCGIIPSGNKFANDFSNFWFVVATGCRLKDTQSGFRLYPLSKIRILNLATAGYEFEVEIIVKSAWNHIEIRSVPIHVNYPPNRVSHFNPYRDFLRISRLNTRLVLRGLLWEIPWNFVRSLMSFNAK